jgi:hypothetical protein
MSMTELARATIICCYGKAKYLLSSRVLAAVLDPEPRLGPRIFAFLGWVRANPGRGFAAFAALHAAVWTALPALLYPNLPLDLIEALLYGREWQLGYDKLPPLPWWLIELTHMTFGHDSAYYLLAQVAVLSALALVFVAARPLVGALGALVAVLIIDGLHYFNFTAPKFNHDVIQLPLWALAGLAFHRALRGGRLPDWLLLGLAVGMSLWAKYFVVVLAAPMVLFTLIDRDARRTLATPGPWIALATTLVVVAPHVVWLVRTDFLPLAYAEHRAILPRGWYDHLWHPFDFAVSQLFFLIPSLCIAGPLFAPSRWTSRQSAASPADAFDRRIVTWLAFGPLATVLAMSAVSGRGTVAMWGYPLWLFLGTWLVLQGRYLLDDTRLARILLTWAVVFSCLAAAFVIGYGVQPRYDHRDRAVFFPGAGLGQQISQRFTSATGEPLRYVVGSMWNGGNVAHYAPTQPRVLIDGDPKRAPWIDLQDLRKHGGVVVWTTGNLDRLPGEFSAVAAGAEVQTPLLLRVRIDNSYLAVGWAILRPER